MKILYINEKILYGGTEVQNNREADIMKKNGHDVYKLYFSRAVNLQEKNVVDKNTYFIDIKQNLVLKVIDKIGSRKQIIYNIQKIIDKIKPDIIRVNNITTAPFSQYQALNGYIAIQTVRDYSFICPKRTGIDNDGRVCSGFNCNNCIKKCLKFNPIKIIKYFRLKKLYKMRNTYIKSFISPSKQLSKYLDLNKYNNNNILNDCLEIEDKEFDLKKKFTEDRYLFFGALNDEIKGIFSFIEKINIYKKEFVIYVAGKIEDEKSFNKYIKNNNNVIYLGELSNSEILKTLENVKCVIIPSRCQENYPNTALEAIANKALVIGSDRGGIPEIILNDRRFLFNPDKCDEVLKVLNNVEKLEFNEYLKIVNDNYNRLIIKNGKKSYFEKLSDIIQENIE